MNTIQSNIQNLTTLWSTICEHHGTHLPSSDFDICFIEDAAWPRRLWFHSKMDPSILDQALKKAPASITITTWDTINGSDDRLLEDRGFQLKSEQVGMYLPLANYTKSANDLTLNEVSKVDEAKEWERLFHDAFGYQIQSQLLLEKPQNLEVFTALYDAQHVGTAMLFRHPDNIVGLHSMGIIPTMQRKGLGEKLVGNLLNLSKERGAEYITLQASMAGLPLYQKIGFESQFIMKNYTRKDTN